MEDKRRWMLEEKKVALVVGRDAEGAANCLSGNRSRGFHINMTTATG